jgi:hypothetical protein
MKEGLTMTSDTSGFRRVEMNASDVRFIWTEGGNLEPDGMFRWLAGCSWVLVAAWHGARVVVSATPPPDVAREHVNFVKGFLEEHLQGPAVDADVNQWLPRAEGRDTRWLCEVCSQYVPKPAATARPTGDDSCLKCGCSHEMHISCRGPFDHGCGMAWVDEDYGDPDPGYVALIHCPCDGYAPPAVAGRDPTNTSASGDGLRLAVSETPS